MQYEFFEKMKIFSISNQKCLTKLSRNFPCHFIQLIYGKLEPYVFMPCFEDQNERHTPSFCLFQQLIPGNTTYTLFLRYLSKEFVYDI